MARARATILIVIVLLTIYPGSISSMAARSLTGRLPGSVKIVHAILPTRSSDWYYLRSPDGHYTARLFAGEAEIDTLDILESYRPRRRPAWKYPVASVRGVNGVVWLPRHPHTIAFGTFGAYTPARLGLWDGTRIITLIGVKIEGQALFELRGVTSDGATLLYRCSGMNPQDHGYNGPLWAREQRIPRTFRLCKRFRPPRSTR